MTLACDRRFLGLRWLFQLFVPARWRRLGDLHLFGFCLFRFRLFQFRLFRFYLFCLGRSAQPFLSLELFLGPGVLFQTVVSDGAGIDDDGLMAIGGERHPAEVERGGLERVEEEPGGFGVELASKDEAHDLHEGDLDGIGVLEDGHGETERGGGRGVQGNVLALPFFVKETVAALAQSGGAALGAIGFDVGAPRDMNVIEHERVLHPSPHGPME